MPLPVRGTKTAHRYELIGLLELAVGVFVALCLISYDAFDPSLNSYSPGREVQNLGGVIGSYLADFLITLVGYAAYLIPVSLIGIVLLQFIRKEFHNFRLRVLSLLLGIVLFSVLAHLQLDPIGRRAVDAGGLIGWGLGEVLVKFLGSWGTTLFLLAGLLFALVGATQISVGRLWGYLNLFSRLVTQRVNSLGVLLWARIKKNLSQWGKKTYQKTVVRPAPAPRVVTAEKVVEKAVPGPRILPRIDMKEKKKEQLELIPPPPRTDYVLPLLDYLESEAGEQAKVDEESLQLNSKLLEKKLLDYGVEGKITEIHPGPIITMYEFEPASGVKVNKIVNLEDDLALTMGGKSVRIIAPLPGKAAVGIEIPNNLRETVWLKNVIEHSKFQRSDSKLTLALGKDTEGIPFVADLGKMPHLLVAGATGSGKSVSINSMILSLLYKATPEEVRLVMVDLKMLELSAYEGIPHLLLPVVTQPRRAALALHWAVKEMERRYEILSQKTVRNIAGYNRVVGPTERLPYIVIVIDELADLMMTTSHEVERLITRLAQMARAAGIHLILATQRPSVDVITGLIKANFPARISFKVTSKHDSRTIIDTVGSEHLLGSGDMLFMSGTSRLLRVHGAYVTEQEIQKVVDHCKNQGKPQYLAEEALKVLEESKTDAEGDGGEEDLSDELYDQAVRLVTETRQASISMVQRRMRIGYNRAARLIERMEKEGVVGPADGAKPREVFASSLTEEVP